jgi:hypothetical protein
LPQIAAVLGEAQDARELSELVAERSQARIGDEHDHRHPDPNPNGSTWGREDVVVEAAVVVVVRKIAVPPTWGCA